MLASRTIVEHLARGIIGAGALAGAAVWTASYPFLWLLAIPVALVAFRGCPMCWTMGLVETVIAQVRGRSTEAGRAGVASHWAPRCPIPRHGAIERRGPGGGA